VSCRLTGARSYGSPYFLPFIFLISLPPWSDFPLSPDPPAIFWTCTWAVCGSFAFERFGLLPCWKAYGK
jgi:hypothetical protein